MLAVMVIFGLRAIYQSEGLIPFSASIFLILGVSAAVWWFRSSKTKDGYETIKFMTFWVGFGLIASVILLVILGPENFAIFIGSITVIIGSLYWFFGRDRWGFGESNKHIEILPDINPNHESTENYRLTSQSDTIFSSETMSSTILPIVIMGPFMIGVPGFFMFGFIMAAINGAVDWYQMFNSGYYLLFLGMLLAIAVGIYLVYQKIKEFRVLLQMKPGELILSSWPLKLGEEVDATYSRVLSEEFDVKEVTPRLICKSTYEIPDSDGKGTETKKRIVQKINYSYFKPSNEGSVNHQFTMAIPEEGPPSFERPDHKYEWYLKVDFEIESFPNDSSLIKLLVLPEVVNDGNQAE